MGILCFTNYVKILKIHSNNHRISNENFMRDYFDALYTTCGIQNDSYWLEKDRVSLLMNRKANLPKNLVYSIQHIEFSTLVSGLTKFYDININKYELSNLIKELEQLGTTDIIKNIKKLSEYEIITYYLVECTKNDNKITSKKHCLYKRNDNELNYVFDDIISIGFNKKYFKKSKIVVIPVDTEYHMFVTKSKESNIGVSPITIHGKWLNKFNDLELKKVAKRFKNYKKSLGHIEQYVRDNTIFYLLACSRFNKSNKAQSTKNNIKRAIIKLLKYYDENGQGEEVFLPLVGSGRSRAELTILESFELIKETILENKHYLHGIINIVIYTKNRDEMEEFLNGI